MAGATNTVILAHAWQYNGIYGARGTLIHNVTKEDRHCALLCERGDGIVPHLTNYPRSRVLQMLGMEFLEIRVFGNLVLYIFLNRSSVCSSL